MGTVKVYVVAEGTGSKPVVDRGIFPRALEGSHAIVASPGITALTIGVRFVDAILNGNPSLAPLAV